MVVCDWVDLTASPLAGARMRSRSMGADEFAIALRPGIVSWEEFDRAARPDVTPIPISLTRSAMYSLL